MCTSLPYFNMKHTCKALLEATDYIWDYFSAEIHFRKIPNQV